MRACALLDVSRQTLEKAVLLDRRHFIHHSKLEAIEACYWISPIVAKSNSQRWTTGSAISFKIPEGQVTVNATAQDATARRPIKIDALNHG